jgi:hypothetical protein
MGTDAGRRRLLNSTALFGALAKKHYNNAPNSFAIYVYPSIGKFWSTTERTVKKCGVGEFH